VVDIKTALKLAILSNPEAFGLRASDLNPLHILAERKAIGEDKEYEGDDLETQILECFEGCDTLLTSKVAELLKGVPEKKPAKPRRGESSKGPKISTKQLRFLGYLIRQTGEEPDYKELKKLTQAQASKKIAEMEKEQKE